MATHTKVEKVGVDHYRYMNSPEWEKIRRQVAERDQYRCQICNHKLRIENKKGISEWFQIHHTSYNNLGSQDEIEDCITLCPRHHKGIHNTINYLRERKNDTC